MSMKSTKKILLSIACLVALLVATFYAMHYVRSPAFQEGLGMLFGPSENSSVRIWNWCPIQTTEVVMHGKSYRADEMNPICRVEIEPLELNTQDVFHPLAEAIMPDHKVILEANGALEVFRVEGMPFRSKKLTDFVKGQGSNSQ